MSKLNREDTRAAIFGSIQFKNKKIKIFGVDVEVRQPSIGELSAMNVLDPEKPDRNALIELMIQYSYVPGTDEKVFEESDREYMLGFPMDDWAGKFQETWMKLAGIDAEESLKNSEATTTGKTS